jgi:thymidylate synthase (FAD)
MKLIKPYFEIITPINGEEILKQIELAARTCYKSESKIEYRDFKDNFTEITVKDHYAKSARTLIPKLLEKGHEAMLEFGGMITVKFICDRGISHELVRHRVASFAQESTRYCNYSKGEHITFIIPCWLDIEEMDTKSNPEYLPFVSKGAEQWFDAMQYDEENYNLLIKQGWTPQQARGVLPNSLKTEINISANIREWRHIFKLRTAKVAHPQMRELMCPLLDKFKELIPILFNDINY